ncbi:MAG: hypothetical protein WC438_00825 [Candidatus Pacearchaeota archaeon]
MKQKRAVLVLILFLTIFCIFLISAATDEEKIAEAYSCLEKNVGSACTLGTTSQTALALMALSYNYTLQQNCLVNLNKSMRDSGNFTCWKATSSGDCDIKSTALSLLAWDYLGKDTEKAQNWLLSKKILPTNVLWYLEIDSNEPTRCEAYIDAGNLQIFNINEDKTITKSSGSSNCLTLASNLGNYFVKIDPSCYSSTFEIKCDKSFITTLLYQRQGSSVYYVSSQTNTPDNQGFTTERINSYCLGSGSTCDYEGTLWASLALDKTGNEVSDLLPYLNIAKEEGTNVNYLPSAFLYLITGSSDFLSEVMAKQRNMDTYRNAFWQVSGDKFYDTALGIYATKAQEAKDYLLQNQDIGANKGCWNPTTSGNLITDTSFILFAGWPRLPIGPESCVASTSCSSLNYTCGEYTNNCGDTITCGSCSSGYYCNNYRCINQSTDCEDECEEGDTKCSGKLLKICGDYNDDVCLEWSPSSHNDTITCPKQCSNGKCTNTTGTTTTTKTNCETAGYFCIVPGDCSSSNTLSSNTYSCSWPSDVCCSKNVVSQSCSQKGGKICSSGQDCSVNEVSASDTNYCCVGGTCEDSSTPSGNGCEDRSYNCRTSCQADEEIKNYDCEFSSDSCCGPITESGTNWLLIILLIVLIILVVLAIIFRKQLKVWLFRMKSGFSKKGGPTQTTRPSMPPPGMPRQMMMPRQIIPRGRMPPQQMRRPVPRQSNDSVFDDTMKKLREMTK